MQRLSTLTSQCLAAVVLLASSATAFAFEKTALGILDGKTGVGNWNHVEKVNGTVKEKRNATTKVASEPIVFAHDALGSIVARVDANNTTATTLQRFDAWGTLRGVPYVKPAAGQNQLAYTGHIFDPETGLTYAKARYLDNGLGRWLSQDPLLGRLSSPLTLGSFNYVSMNPTSHWDPDGRAFPTSCGPDAVGCQGEDVVDVEVATKNAPIGKTPNPTLERMKDSVKGIRFDFKAMEARRLAAQRLRAVVGGVSAAVLAGLSSAKARIVGDEGGPPPELQGSGTGVGPLKIVEPDSLPDPVVLPGTRGNDAIGDFEKAPEMVAPGLGDGVDIDDPRTGDSEMRAAPGEQPKPRDVRRGPHAVGAWDVKRLQEKGRATPASKDKRARAATPQGQWLDPKGPFHVAERVPSAAELPEERGTVPIEPGQGQVIYPDGSVEPADRALWVRQGKYIHTYPIDKSHPQHPDYVGESAGEVDEQDEP